MMDFVTRCAGEDFDLILLGGERERLHHAALMEAASNHGAGNVRDAGTGNSLEDFFAIVERCNIVLTADSLALHVAVALGRPVVAWFGPTCEKEIDLFGLGEKLVTDFPCSPCYLKSCPKDVFCLGELTAREVLVATRRVLAGASASTGAPR
jgi:heptosyltransferase-2